MSRKNSYLQIANMLSLINQLAFIMLIPSLGLSFLGKFVDNKFLSKTELVNAMSKKTLIVLECSKDFIVNVLKFSKRSIVDGELLKWYI